MLLPTPNWVGSVRPLAMGLLCLLRMIWSVILAMMPVMAIGRFVFLMGSLMRGMIRPPLRIAIASLDMLRRK